ncbi:GntR family transcriptional regulator [uncultured Pseudokineococcus sp.]|uniref:GntR family transcriptional regulator n=1 Tax=uncultured Pseudokineococcus sp. TaxID=1642928 RepID=UPI0026063922|nr:GntR family transcriptional regulator [uncultured Pseudokineococcus sp.]
MSTAPTSTTGATSPGRGLPGAGRWHGVVPGDGAASAPGATAAEQVAAVLRALALEGGLRPGEQLSEQALGAALGVSRNTLREAFRTLGEEGLVEHQPHRGVFVRLLRADDLRDLWALREVLECGALERAAAGTPPPPEAVGAVRTARRRGEEAATAGDWRTVGTANMALHAALAALAGSPRTDAAVRRLLAEVRLAFSAAPDPRAVHEPWLPANALLAELVEEGRLAEAVPVLREYLRASGRSAVASPPTA